MAITIGNSSNAASATVTKPASVATGDSVYVAVAGTGSGFSISGFTNEIEISGVAYTVAILSRVLDGSEGSTWTLGGGSASGNVALALRPGSGNTLILDGTPTSNSAGNGSTATCGAITLANTNDVLMTAFASSGGAHTPPGGMTEIADFGGVVGMSMDYQAIASSGSTGTRAATSAGIRMVGVMLAVKETSAAITVAVPEASSTLAAPAPTAIVTPTPSVAASTLAAPAPTAILTPLPSVATSSWAAPAPTVVITPTPDTGAITFDAPAPTFYSWTGMDVPAGGTTWNAPTPNVLIEAPASAPGTIAFDAPVPSFYYWLDTNPAATTYAAPAPAIQIDAPVTVAGVSYAAPAPTAIITALPNAAAITFGSDDILIPVVVLVPSAAMFYGADPTTSEHLFVAPSADILFDAPSPAGEWGVPVPSAELTIDVPAPFFGIPSATAPWNPKQGAGLYNSSQSDPTGTKTQTAGVEGAVRKTDRPPTGEVS